MSDHDQDGFDPPAVPRVRFDDPIKGAAIVGVIGAPVVYVIVGILLTYQPVIVGAVCVVVFAASFITLFVRAKDRAPQDDGWDDGAVL
ncbi:MAG: hypothetical protein ACOYD0_05755 [Candidatus Nanopelagicales bacterium]